MSYEFNPFTGNLDIVDNSKLRFATLVVAASDSKDTTNADYICDGTSDQEEINDAIDALPAGGGRVLLMEGNYNIDGQIQIDVNNTTIQGQGFSTILDSSGWDAPASASAVIYCDALDNIILKNFTIKGTSVNRANVYAIYQDTGNYLNLNNVIINTWQWDYSEAVRVGNLSTVTNCIFREIKNKSYCLRPRGVEGGSITDNIFDNVSAGIFSCNQHYSIVGNTFSTVNSTNQYAIDVEGDECVIVGNNLDVAQLGIRVIANRCIVSNNWIEAAITGIIIDGDDNTIQNNIINNATTGIKIETAEDNNRLLNNIFISCTTDLSDSGTDTTQVDYKLKNIYHYIGGYAGIFTHANTADRTYTFPDKTGTVAMTSDITSSIVDELYLEVMG